MSARNNSFSAGLRRTRSRAGLSLIEVIACTVIVTVLIIPIAAVVKMSGRAIKRVETDSTTPQRLRSASTWMRDTLRTSELYEIEKDYLTFQLPSGKNATMLRSGRNLVMDDGSNVSVICEGIDEVWFAEILTASKPGKPAKPAKPGKPIKPGKPSSLGDRVGLIMTITARDPMTGVPSKIQTTVAKAL